MLLPQHASLARRHPLDFPTSCPLLYLVPVSTLATSEHEPKAQEVFVKKDTII